MADTIKQFEALFNYATIGIVVTDAQGSIINFNRKAESDFGYTKEEVLGKPVDILLPQSLKSKHEHYRSGFYKHPSPRAMGAGRDLYGLKKDGSVFPVEVSLSNYTIENSIFVIAFVIDITIRKNSEEIQLAQKNELERVSKEVKQLNAGLEKKIEDRTKMLRETLTALEKSKGELSEALKTEKELGELKSRFVSMASHEFKTPLSTILSSSYLLEQYNNIDAPEKRIKHIERIKNAVGDMKNILDDFLSLDKLDEGLIRADIKPMSAEDCVKEFDLLISEMQINLKPGQKINFEYTGNSEVMLDKHLLRNICMNLLSNATKFSPEASMINVTAGFNADSFNLSIQDYGIGISESDMQHLFERFFRAKNAFNIQGTGLGLHIVAKYVELMNGDIKIESKLDEGTTFTIRIPKSGNETAL
ncbi:PAS domain-containing sensor histidine kinase [Parafilimonas terrae]|uniref:histidine kinase n=1 Tax=Parafilimonas terrae TaxID=1465490 RepID=A0A1I5YTN1_9BACT|nr:PAS domain-containing sensor histidine kinase [Parafilimonas terrae]SFQ47566.1 PAS domain S-box-containing protein [Parafilimonas terrae]